MENFSGTRQWMTPVATSGYLVPLPFNGRYDRPFSQSETDLRDEPHTQFALQPPVVCAECTMQG